MTISPNHVVIVGYGPVAARLADELLPSVRRGEVSLTIIGEESSAAYNRVLVADLVLLIVAALSDDELRSYLALTHELGMNAVVETHTAEEIARAVAVDAKIIGINVRNLKTLDVDRGVFAALAGNIPDGAIVVAESGVRDVADVEHYSAHGAHAILVGEALVKDATPRERITEFKTAGALAISTR